MPAKATPEAVNGTRCTDKSVAASRRARRSRTPTQTGVNRGRARERVQLVNKSLVCLCFLATLVVARGASAAPSQFHPDLRERLMELDRARGPLAYSALRRVWDTWDRADPEQVEQSLLLAAQSEPLTPSARAYAATLAAYARLRRGDLKAAELGFRKLGYVERWLVVGPFDNEGKAGLAAAHGPELELTRLSSSKAYTGKERPVRWRQAPNVFSHAFLDLGALVRPESKVCAFVASFVRGDDKQTRPEQVTAWIGSGGAFRLFWNGNEAYSHETYARHDFERIAVPVSLEPGPNLFVLKVCGDERAPTISARFSDERGNPKASLRFSNEFSEPESVNEPPRAAVKAQKKLAKLQGPEGPVQTFERLTKRPHPTVADLEAYARYLDETDGDDPALHLARDLARRASEREPNVERLLLSARLAEDRNQANEWIEKAERLASASKTPNRDLLLARAWHRRHGPNFREARPYFEAVLALDPTNVGALRGTLELYNLAGLPRTALARIERAVEERPNSVGLLSLYAAELRLLGRATDAREVEARYHRLRFDDASYLGAELELALSRKNRTAAEHWATRLVATQPYDPWAIGTAARAYRRLGQPDRALAMHRAALLLAPEDVGTLRALSDLEGDLGRQSEQLSLLREVLRIRPQDKNVREYLENTTPEKPRVDEAYAWSPDRFLYLRHAQRAGQSRRTLRDLTVSTVFENGLSSEFRQIVFQPLTDAAAAQDRQYAFGYEADRQVVQLRGAKIYRKNGKVDEAVEWGEGPADDPTIAMYTSARTFYVQLPRLEAGDVVELRYRIDDVTPRNEFADYFGEVVYMGGTDPTANAEYVLFTPKSRKILADAQVPGLEISTTSVGNSTVRRFFAKSVPPIQPEPAMPPLSEVLGFVHVSTYETWKDLGRWYYGLVKDQFDLDDVTRTLAHKVVLGKRTDLEKVQAIYDWVTRNTRYVALEFGIYGYKPRRCVQTIARGWGDCKDKATVLATLLREVGVPAKLVVLRTQMRGDFHSKLPSFAPFDHAIAYVPSLDVYLDGTAEHTGVFELPRMDLGALGLLVGENDSTLTRLPLSDPQKNFVRRKAEVRLSATGEAKLDLEYTTGGFVSAEWRRRYHAKSTLRERVNSDLGGEYPGFEILPGAPGVVTSDLENATAEVRLHVKGTAATFARREGDDLSMAVTSSLRMTPTFASLSSRTQDVVTRGFSSTEDAVTVNLPAGAEVVSGPDSTRGDSGFGSYSVDVSRDKDKVIVKSRVAVKVARISPREYPAWRRFCEEIDRALAPRLVVRP